MLHWCLRRITLRRVKLSVCELQHVLQYNVQQNVEPENVQYNVYQRKMESTKEEELVPF